MRSTTLLFEEHLSRFYSVHRETLTSKYVERLIVLFVKKIELNSIVTVKKNLVLWQPKVSKSILVSNEILTEIGYTWNRFSFCFGYEKDIKCPSTNNVVPTQKGKNFFLKLSSRKIAWKDVSLLPLNHTFRM